MPVEEIKIVRNDGLATYTTKMAAIVVAPVLAVHEDVERCKTKKVGWTVTHIRSGHAVCKELPSRKDAKIIAKKLSKIMNWEEFNGNVKTLPKKLFDKIVAFLDVYVR